MNKGMEWRVFMEVGKKSVIKLGNKWKMWKRRSSGYFVKWFEYQASKENGPG